MRNILQRYMKEQTEIEENHLAQQPPWLLNNIYFYYDRDLPTNNDNEEKQCFLQHKKKIQKKLKQMGQRAYVRR